MRSDAALFLVLFYSALEWVLICLCYWCLAQSFAGIVNLGPGFKQFEVFACPDGDDYGEPCIIDPIHFFEEAKVDVTEHTFQSGQQMAELLAAMGLDRVPVDPDGNPYKLTPEGRVEVRVPDDFAFATKGLPPGYKPPPKAHAQF